MFCSKCGKELHDEAVICVNCGCATNNKTKEVVNSEGHEWLVALLFSWFLGCFGAHRFYTGHIVTAVVQLLTLGGCGIWAFIDWVLICFNKFNDYDGKPLTNYKKDIGPILFVVGLLFSILYLLFAVVGAAVGE